MKKVWKRLLSGFVAVSLMGSILVQAVPTVYASEVLVSEQAAAEQVQTPESPLLHAETEQTGDTNETLPAADGNLVGDASFESGTLTGEYQTGKWKKSDWRNGAGKLVIEITSDDVSGSAGSKAVRVKGQNGSNDGGVNQKLTGLEAGQKYRLSARVKKVSGSQEQIVGILGIGAAELKLPITDTNWAEVSGEFTYEPSATTKAPEVYVYQAPGAGEILVDEIKLVKVEPEQPQPPVVELPLLWSNNLLGDAGFESGSLTSDYETGRWMKNDWAKNMQTAVIDGSVNARPGSKVVSVKGGAGSKDGGVAQKVNGLQEGQQYQLSAWAKKVTSNREQIVGIKGIGTNELKLPISSTEWTEISGSFTFAAGGQPEVYVYQAPGAGEVLVDDVKLSVVNGLEMVQGTNGQIVVTMSDAAAQPAQDAFTMSYTSAGAGTENTAIAWTGSKTEAGRITLDFAAIPQIPVPQEITLTLTYNDKQVSFPMTIPAGDGEVVQASVVKVDAKANGTAVVTLDVNPTVRPDADDFVLQSVIDEKISRMVITDFAYDAEKKQVTLSYDPISAAMEPQTVQIAVAYNGKTVTSENSFTVDPRVARTYYVTANTEDTGFVPAENAQHVQSIAQLNEITFQPGDRILFRKGEKFTGTFKPKGSGEKNAPIVVSSYGTGAKPILEPGLNDNFDDILQKGSGGSKTTTLNVQYRGSIILENVQQWEIRDLELTDETWYMQNRNTDHVKEFDKDKMIFPSGIRVLNKNAGNLYHFVFDNLTIHHFRGPSINEGKSSGGINFNVLVDPGNSTSNSGKNKPSAMHNIRITNSEIYECGRSGVNFLNPWQRRDNSDPKWQPVNEAALPYHPYTNFYFGNNIVHHIDGDGLIVDTVRNAIVEKNLVYETTIHLGRMHAAVGMFNWDSDDVYFQYNEIFNVGKNATGYRDGTGAYYNPGEICPGDAHGIEIDALNDRTWVQYNYVHDNRGGFMMWCNTANHIPSFDGVVRYNISQNDVMTHHGVFQHFKHQFNPETYNNVFYLDERDALAGNTVNLITSHEDMSNRLGENTSKFYNNIFYLEGETPRAANRFNDGAFDWRSNIFYNFTNKPVDDDPAHPNFHDDPMFVAPGTGHDYAADARYTDPGKAPANTKYAVPTIESLRKDLEGYKVRPGSPAADAGVRLASMNVGVPDFSGKPSNETPDDDIFFADDRKAMTDFFGNAVDENPDIGVHEITVEDPSTKPVWIKSRVDAIRVSEENTSVSMTGSAAVAQARQQLFAPGSAEVSFLRNETELADHMYLVTGDTIRVANGEAVKNYKVTVTPAKLSSGKLEELVPVTDYTYTTGSQQDTVGWGGQDLNVEGPLRLAFDGNPGTIWHSNAAGGDTENQYVDFALVSGKQYDVIGLRYLPRPGNTQSIPNGRIGTVSIQGKNGDSEFAEIKSVTWNKADTDLKTILFDAPVQYDTIRFQVRESQNSFATAAELGLLVRIAPAAPTNVRSTDEQSTSALLQWNPVEDAVSYLIVDAKNQVVGQTEQTSFQLNDLVNTKSSKYFVYAVDAQGILSDAVSVVVFAQASQLPQAPGTVQVTEVTHNSARISWEKPASAANLAGYEIRKGEQVLASVDGTDTLTVVLENLDYAAEYTGIKVYAKNQQGQLSDSGAAVPRFTTLVQPLAIPGWTKTTLPLDANKNYMIVARATNGDLFALYPNAAYKDVNPGDAINSATVPAGSFAALLTLTQEGFTAKLANAENTPVQNNALVITAQPRGGDRAALKAANGLYLNMTNSPRSMFTESPVEWAITMEGDAFKLVNKDRRLDFNKKGDENEFKNNNNTFETNFWARGKNDSVKLKIYLFEQDGVRNRAALEAKIAQAEALQEKFALNEAQQQVLADAKALLENAQATPEMDQAAMEKLDKLMADTEFLQPKPQWQAKESPDTGVTSNQPFTNGTVSGNFRIPALIALKHNKEHPGRQVAAIDARWDHGKDGSNLDTILSYSDDNGETWHYSFPNYFNDSTDRKHTLAASFIDPVLVEDLDGSLYMMVDLYSGGVSLPSNTGAPRRPDAATGYEEVNGELRMVLYTMTGDTQTSENWSYYVGDFVEQDGKRFAPVIAKGDTEKTPVYYVDGEYYLYSAEKTPMWCQQLDSDKYVKQNVFFVNARLHVREATFLWLTKSTDGGETWGDPLILNPMVRPQEGTAPFYGAGPGAGLVLTEGPAKGMILIPGYLNDARNPNKEQASFLYSQDGIHWKRSDDVTGPQNSESTLVQLDETTVRQFFRSADQKLVYRDHKLVNNEWKAVAESGSVDVPRTAWNQMSAIRHSRQINGKDVIILSTASYTTAGQDKPRKKGVLYVFTVNDDTAHTMNLEGVYNVTGDNDPYGYSSLTELANGDIALLHERNWGDPVYRQVSWQNVTAAVIDETNVIPVEELEITTGSFESGNPTEGNPAYALDGNPLTIWHTKYSGDDRSKFYLEITLPENADYQVNGLLYVSRPGLDLQNGKITEYKVEGQLEGSDTWQELAVGEWSYLGSQRKERVDFAAANYQKIRFSAVDSVSRTSTAFATAAEIRLLAAADKTELLDTVHKAQKLLPSSAQYTPESWENLLAALESASRTAEDPAADQTQVDHAANALRKAMTDLEKVPAQDEEVRAVVQQIEAIGKVDLSKEAAVKQARADFEKLTEEQKKLVTNIDKLIAAETALSTMYKLTGAGLSIDGNIAVNFYFDFSEEMVRNASVVITVADSDPITMHVTEDRMTKDGYKFTASVSVRQMTDNIQIKVMKDGSQIGNAKDFSVRKYADILLKDEANRYPENAKEFTKAMLYHGAAMQEYKQYNTAYLATKDLMGLEALEAAANAVKAEDLPRASKSGKEPAGLKLYGMNLNLEDETTLRFFFTKGENYDASRYTFNAGANPIHLKENEEYVCIEIQNISASRLDDEIRLVVSDETDTLTVTYSPLSYARTVLLDKMASPALQKVARSLVVYNKAANALNK